MNIERNLIQHDPNRSKTPWVHEEILQPSGVLPPLSRQNPYFAGMCHHDVKYHLVYKGGGIRAAPTVLFFHSYTPATRPNPPTQKTSQLSEQVGEWHTPMRTETFSTRTASSGIHCPLTFTSRESSPSSVLEIKRCVHGSLSSYSKDPDPEGWGPGRQAIVDISFS